MLCCFAKLFVESIFCGYLHSCLNFQPLLQATAKYKLVRLVSHQGSNRTVGANQASAHGGYICWTCCWKHKDHIEENNMSQWFQCVFVRKSGKGQDARAMLRLLTAIDGYWKYGNFWLWNRANWGSTGQCTGWPSRQAGPKRTLHQGPVYPQPHMFCLLVNQKVFPKKVR